MFESIASEIKYFFPYQSCFWSILKGYKKGPLPLYVKTRSAAQSGSAGSLVFPVLNRVPVLSFSGWFDLCVGKCSLHTAYVCLNPKTLAFDGCQALLPKNQS